MYLREDQTPSAVTMTTTPPQRGSSTSTRPHSDRTVSSESGVHTTVSFLLQVYIILQVIGSTVEAGTCWIRMGTNGRCQYMWEVGVSKEKCCHGTGVDWAWSPHDSVTSSQRFYWHMIEHGAPQCKRCHDTCDNVVCPDGKKCRIRRNEPRCVCASNCSRDEIRRRLPVCGSDGRTYRHRCAMLKYNCRHSENVYMDYYGKCKRSCAHVRCENKHHCVADQNGLPHCITCLQHCARSSSRDRPLCGSDNQTYRSMCLFREANCYGGGKISIAYRGQCKANITCKEMKCGWGQHCLQHIPSGRFQCLMCNNIDCAMIMSRGPICGTDNRTYTSWCQLRTTACHSGIVIKTKHNGACHEGDKGSIDNYYYSSGSASFE